MVNKGCGPSLLRDPQSLKAAVCPEGVRQVTEWTVMVAAADMAFLGDTADRIGLCSGVLQINKIGFVGSAVKLGCGLLVSLGVMQPQQEIATVITLFLFILKAWQ